MITAIEPDQAPGDRGADDRDERADDHQRDHRAHSGRARRPDRVPVLVGPAAADLDRLRDAVGEEREPAGGSGEPDRTRMTRLTARSYRRVGAVTRSSPLR